jgi:hypothetical protein
VCGSREMAIEEKTPMIRNAEFSHVLWMLEVFFP